MKTICTPMGRDIWCGSTLAVKLAHETGEAVCWNHNDVDVVVKPGDDQDAALRQLGRNREHGIVHHVTERSA